MWILYFTVLATVSIELMVVPEATTVPYDHVLHRTSRQQLPKMTSDNHRQGFCFAEEEGQPVSYVLIWYDTPYAH